MKLEQIAQVIELSAVGSFSKAAQNLYMSQPNLSKSIRQLEQELQTELFERTSQGLVPTTACREFLLYANSIQKNLNLMQSLFSAKSETRLACSVATLWLPWVGKVYTDFVLRYIDRPIRFSLHQAVGREALYNMVETNQVELGLVLLLEGEKNSFLRRIKSKNLDYHIITKGRSCIAVGEHNPLYQAGYTEVTLEMLHGMPMVFSGENQKNHFFRLLAQRSTLDYSLESVIRVGDSETMNHIIASSNAFTYIYHIPTQFSCFEDVHFLPLKGSQYDFEIGWIKPQRSTLSDITQEFLDDVIQTATGKGNKNCVGK